MGSGSRSVLEMVAVVAIAECGLIVGATLLDGLYLGHVVFPSLLPAAALTAVVAVVFARRRDALTGAGATDLEAPTDLAQRIGVKPRAVTAAPTAYRAVWRRSPSREDVPGAIARRRVS